MRYSIKTLNEIVQISGSWAEVCRRIGLSQTGNNKKYLVRKCAENEISWKHFTGRSNDIARTSNKKPLSEILVENSHYSSYHLKKDYMLKMFLMKFAVNVI